MSSNKSAIFKLKGVIRNYDWGGTDFLSDLLSYPNPFKQPMAEYWLGAHDSSPSLLETSNGDVELNRFIANERKKILGKTVAKKFGRLPYLLKLLDVKDMLSIQVHPSKHAAEIEFARENAEGIPLDARHRNYRDDNHKPELAVALNNFWLIHGFKPVEKLRGTLQSIPELKPLLNIFDETGYDQLYKTVMEMPQESVNQLLQPLLDRIIPLYQQNKLTKDQEDFWGARAALSFNPVRPDHPGGQQPTTSNQQPIDRGIFSIYFFNLLHLKKREGIFQDAGVPHAYLEGQNVEIMANSDNVLRGGLTTKHIDVKELMKNIKFEETVPHILHPQKINHEEVYRTAAPDFKLSHFELEKDDSSLFESATGEILLVIKGNLLIGSDADQLELTKGEAAFIISHQQIALKALSNADLYRASVPVHSSE
jgi:mannose-6-phosphate isomerase